MARKRKGPKGPRDPFKDLDDDFKGAAEGMKTEELRLRLAKIAAAQEDNLKAQKEDRHLQEAKAAVKDANAQYREATKMNRLRTQYILRVLTGRGQEA